MHERLRGENERNREKTERKGEAARDRTRQGEKLTKSKNQDEGVGTKPEPWMGPIK